MGQFDPDGSMVACLLPTVDVPIDSSLQKPLSTMDDNLHFRRFPVTLFVAGPFSRPELLNTGPVGTSGCTKWLQNA